MRRYLPEHFKRNGKPKRSYTQEEAVAATKKFPDQKAYQCGECGAWHLAHR